MSDEFKKVRFHNGELLVEEGTLSDYVYLITRGKVEVRKGMKTSPTPKVLATVGKGEVVGEISMFDGQPHVATAVAVTDVEATAMSREEFEKKLDTMDTILRGTVLAMVHHARHLADLVTKQNEPPSMSNWRG